MLRTTVYFRQLPSNKVSCFATLDGDKKTTKLSHFYDRLLESVMRFVHTHCMPQMFSKPLAFVFIQINNLQYSNMVGVVIVN